MKQNVANHETKRCTNQEPIYTIDTDIWGDDDDQEYTREQFDEVVTSLATLGPDWDHLTEGVSYGSDGYVRDCDGTIIAEQVNFGLVVDCLGGLLP